MVIYTQSLPQWCKSLPLSLSLPYCLSPHGCRSGYMNAGKEGSGRNKRGEREKERGGGGGKKARHSRTVCLRAAYCSIVLCCDYEVSMEQQDQNKRRRGSSEDTAWLQAWSIKGRLVQNMNIRKEGLLSSTALHNWLTADSIWVWILPPRDLRHEDIVTPNLEDLWGHKSGRVEKLAPHLDSKKTRHLAAGANKQLRYAC